MKVVPTARCALHRAILIVLIVWLSRAPSCGVGEHIPPGRLPRTLRRPVVSADPCRLSCQLAQEVLLTLIRRTGQISTQVQAQLSGRRPIGLSAENSDARVFSRHMTPAFGTARVFSRRMTPAFGTPAARLPDEASMAQARALIRAPHRRGGIWHAGVTCRGPGGILIRVCSADSARRCRHGAGILAWLAGGAVRRGRGTGICACPTRRARHLHH